MSRRPDRLVLAGLVLFPAAVFLVPLAFGHLLLPGDDLVQNYPLRVLTGQDLRHGHLPLWNPYAWSGTPLLGGFNAGSLYPATLLFTFLPGPLAWALGQAATYALAGTGMVVFLRRRGLGVVASGLGAVVFSWSGFMAAQLAHIGLVEGMAWLPWMLLAVDHLVFDQPAPDQPAPDQPGLDRPAGGWPRQAAWAGLLGLAGGLVCLAGDPRGISDVAIVLALYGGWALWRAPAGSRARALGWLAAAAAVAGLLGAGQLLPGLALQSVSQRSGNSYEAFAAGSLAPPLLLLTAFPFFLGGFDSLHLPPYMGDYNLPEISGYLGLLGLAGALMVAVSWRRRPGRADSGAGIWLVAAGVGIVLALGQYTPLAHVLVHVPLYGGQRLQSRNLGIADTAGAVLSALWVERFVERGWRPSPGVRAAGLVAPACIGALILVGVFWPGGAAHWLRHWGALFPRAWPYTVVSVALAAVVTVVVLRGDGWSRGRRARVVVALTVVDVGFFFANAAYGWAPTSSLGTGAGTDPALAAALPPGSRYAVYDPLLIYAGYVRSGPGVLRVPDLNVLSGVPSIQGYGSVVQGPYDAATAAHTQGSFDPGILSDRRADQLELGLVLVGPSATADVTSRLVPPRWVPVGQVDGLPAWRNTDALSPAVLEIVGGRSGAGAEAVVPPLRVGPSGPGGGATFYVDSRTPVVLVRSESWAPGWKAVLHPVASRGGAASTAGPVRSLPVDRSGFLQSVEIPPGNWMVRFSYRPGRTYLALALSGAGLAAGLGLVGVGLVGVGLVGVGPALRRARRPRSAPAPR